MSEVEQTKHSWRNEAIRIYSSELAHWEDIRAYYMSRVVEADVKIAERRALITDLQGVQLVQMEMPLSDMEPVVASLEELKLSPKGLMRNFFHRGGDNVK